MDKEQTIFERAVNVSPSLYDRLVAAGCEIGNHESDLYVESTETSRRIIAEFEAEGSNQSGFINQITKTRWIDLPFHFQPFWDKVSRRASRATL